MYRLSIVASGVAIIAATSTATGEDLIWDNYPEGTGGSYISSQLSWGYFDSQCADDFKFATETQIAAVQWNGGYWPDDPSFPADWNILIYADFDGMPPGGPYDPTDWAEIHYILYWDVVETCPEWDGSYTCTVDLWPPFTAEPGQRYWIAIQADIFYPPQWGISDSKTQQGYEAHTGFPLMDTYYWTPTSDTFGWPMDMAFRLFGASAPPPPPEDINQDGTVDVLDLLLLLDAWGPCPGCPEDITGDGVVDVLDLLDLLAAWGLCA